MKNRHTTTPGLLYRTFLRVTSSTDSSRACGHGRPAQPPPSGYLIFLDRRIDRAPVGAESVFAARRYAAPLLFRGGGRLETASTYHGPNATGRWRSEISRLKFLHTSRRRSPEARPARSIASQLALGRNAVSIYQDLGDRMGFAQVRARGSPAVRYASPARSE